MALSLAEIRELITFGRDQGLQTMSVEGVSVMYGPPKYEPPQSTELPRMDTKEPDLPEELRHYSAVGRAQMGKA